MSSYCLMFPPIRVVVRQFLWLVVVAVVVVVVGTMPALCKSESGF